ncbi:acyl-CoA synthetase [Amycolatopsis jiangsuensis]|uniref:Fatty-acyl-CoA synthase n=1 Tax=Amycolatopsis jiangsuensis TaxID=1181879 RepID=A0A840J4N1_9PSEU|nr:acyl-CoA synthetase [Amycolatopsis jiangsuensis]MBB4688397.1 fatty-acyl-CoA synthase [Amycolatopsis jiangsuensis]
MTENLLWPRYAGPTDLAGIEAVPLAERGLPGSTYALLSRAAATWPDRTAITTLPDATRWREPAHRRFAGLLGEVHRYANLLHELGIRRDDAVALMSPNTAELVPATLAAQLAGIAAPLNGGLSRPHLTDLLRLAGARILITAGPELSPEIWETAHDLARDGHLDTVLVLRPTGTTGAPAELPAVAGVRIGYLGELAAGQDPSVFHGVPPQSGDLAAFFHTGGTTGAPKLAANSLLDEESVLFAALPLFHVNALIVTVLAPLFKGQGAVWAGPLGYRDLALYGQFWKLVEHYRISAMSAVPTVYSVLAQCPVDADLSSLRVAMVGASPLPAAVRENFESHTGITLVEGYGLTEATCASARAFPDSPRPGSVGQRLPYQRMKAVRVRPDGSWEDLPPGQAGILVISGPTVFPGYVTGHGEHGHVLDGLGKLSGGWLDTGDLAHLDPDGFVYLAGRAKDLIIRGGHNIDPAQIEDALLAHPEVTGAGAVGRPDIHSGEVPVAYVTLAPGSSVTELQLREWARGKVPESAAAPKTVTVLDALPVTDVGKPYKPALRADAARRELTKALADVAGVAAIEVEIDRGSVLAVVETASETGESAVKTILRRYAIDWRVTRTP